MRTILLLAGSCTLLAFTATGQSTPARWQRTKDQRTGIIDRTTFRVMTRQSEFLAGFLQDSCLGPTTLQPMWHAEYLSSGPDADRQLCSAVVCQFSPLPEDGSGRPGTSGPELRIITNDLHLLFRDSLVVNKKVFPLLQSTPVPRNEGLFFESTVRYRNTIIRWAPQKFRMWLILPDKVDPPYLPLSRQEYLQEAAQELTEEKASTTEKVKQEIPIRPESAQNAEKDAAIAFIRETCTGSQQQVRIKSFLAKYKPDDILQQEAIAAATAPLDSTLMLMKQLLSRLPASELERPAFVSVAADQFQGFEDLVATTGMLVKPNPSFPRVAPGSTTPALFIAYWVSDPEGSAAPDSGDELIARFQPGKLKQLLK